MERRTFLATTAAATAAVAVKAASAASKCRPLVKRALRPSRPPLPLGPLPGARIRILVWSFSKSPRFHSGPPVSRLSRAPWRSSASRPESVGPKDRFTSRLGVTCCYLTSPTTASCASRRMTVTSAYIASLR